MRQFAIRLAGIVSLLLALGACADGPTLLDAPRAPDRSAKSTAAADTEDHQAPACCETVIVVVPGPDAPPPCDPWTSLSWCAGTGGGDCMTGAPAGDPGPDVLAPAAGSTGCPGGGGGPGGGTPFPPPPPGEGDGSPCDPRSDPSCYKPLTGLDSATIANALARYLRAPAAIPDPTARQQCENMHNAFNSLYANGRVFRGGSTTTAGDSNIEPHTGAYDGNTGKMHIDPLYLDRAALGTPEALRELLDTMLHEGAHALMFKHPNGYTSTPWGPVFSDPYFNLLSPGTNSCLVW